MSDVVGSATFELRASPAKLLQDMRNAEREVKTTIDRSKRDAERGSAALRQAFRESGQTEFSRAMKVIRNASDYTEAEVTAAANRISSDLRSKYRDLGTDIGGTFRGISTSAQVAFAAITAYSLKLAADAQEIESAFDVAFGTASGSARDFANVLADDVGRDAVELREQMTRLQLVLTGTGVAAGDAAKMVKDLTTIGVDAGSLFNTSDAESLQKIISGLTGETEPLKAFGVVLTEAQVQAELLRLGFKGNASEASEAAKSIARANLIIKGLAVAQGDAARTSGSAANQAKAMRAEFNEAARELGTQLIPAMTQLFGATTDVLKAFNDLPGGVQVAGLAFLALIAAGGPIAGLLANLARVIALAKETRAALIAATVVGGGAGAGRAAATGAAAGVAGAVLPTAVATVGVGVGVSSFAPAPPRPNAPVEERLAYARQYQRGSTRVIANLEQELRAQTARRSELSSGIDSLLASGGGATTDSGVIGGFSLPTGLRTGTGRGGRTGSGRASTGPSAEDLAAQREMLTLQGQIELLRAQGRTAEAEAKQRELDIINLTKQYEQAGFENAKSKAEVQVKALSDAELAQRGFQILFEGNQKALDDATEKRQLENDLLLDQLGYRAELARLEGNPDAIKATERRLWVEERINQILALRPTLSGADARSQAEGEATALDGAERLGDLKDQFRRAFSDGIRAAADGDLGGFFESLADRFTDRMLENLADDLFDLLAQAAGSFKAGGGVGGGGDWISTAFNFISKGFGRNALGTSSWRGGLTSVNEFGGEIMNLPRGTQIIPHDLSKRMMSAGGASMQKVRVEVGVNDDRFNAYVDGRAAPMASQAASAAVSGSRTVVPADMAQTSRYTRR